MLERIAAILASRSFDQLLGLVEGSLLEVKSQPYDLTQPAGRYELAKDVVAFANQGGGYLLIGLATARTPGRAEDVVAAVTPISEAAFDSSRCLGIIANHVYPAIRGLTVEWLAQAGAHDGIGVIFVPPQDEEAKPYLIAKVVDDNEYLKMIVAGYAVRVDDANSPLRPDHLHNAFKNGQNPIGQRLARIEEMLARAVAPMPDGSAASGAGEGARVEERVVDRGRFEARIAEIGQSVPAQDLYYVLAAAVPTGNRVTRFFAEGADGVRGLLRDAGHLRDGGFDLTIGANAEGHDDYWEAQQGERKALRLYHDGTLLFRAAADDSFLGWARNRDQFLRQPRLSPVAIVDVHASFVSFLAELLPRFQEAPSEVLFRLRLSSAVTETGTRLFLTRHLPGATWEWVNLPRFVVEKVPPEEELTVAGAELTDDQRAVALRLVEQFYSMFEAPAEIVPFVAEIDGVRRVDVDAIGRR
jgi:hypothetical protein